MERWVGKVAVVTGASAGIGEEVVKQLIENGMNVVGLARRVEKLQELEKSLEGKSGKFYYVKVDLTSEENILAAFKWVKTTLKSIDVLINNAGVWKFTDLLGDTNDWKEMFDTNIIGLNICSREAVKVMQELKTEGHIINVNSVVGHYNISFVKDISVYSATKRGVTSITENFREFMCQLNLPIKVTSVSPGLVDTEMIASKKVPGCPILTSIDVANTIIYVLSTPQHVNITEIMVRPTGESFTKWWNK